MTVSPFLNEYDDPTLEQELSAARSARLAILKMGQSNEVRSMKTWRADLAKVNALIKDLESQIAATSGRAFNHVRLRSPSTNSN